MTEGAQFTWDRAASAAVSVRDWGETGNQRQSRGCWPASPVLPEACSWRVRVLSVMEGDKALSLGSLWKLALLVQQQ